MTTIKISSHTIIKQDVSWTICILIYTSPSLVKEIASVKTKHYRYLVPKQFTYPFYFDKNSNYLHDESVKI